MKILVTGGAGYIGSHFLKELKNNKYNSNDTLTLDNLSNGFKENIIFGKFIKVDLQNKDKIEKIISEFKPDIIVHFAGLISVPDSVKKPAEYYENNFVGSLNLIESAIKNNIKKFIFSSTAAVYGIPKNNFVAENAELNPINPYGNSKKMVEELLKDVKKVNPKFNYIILRYFNVAGSDPHMVTGNRQKVKLNLIPIIINNILNKKNEIKIFGNNWNTPDKTCIRDYIHVTDLVKAHLEVINLLDNSFIFNVGYGKGSSVLEVIEAIEKVTKTKIKRNFVARRAGDPECLIADNSKILSLTNWKPLYNNLNIIVKTAWDWENKNL